MEYDINKLPFILTPKNVQSLLGVGRSVVYQLLNEKEIEHFRIGRLYRIKKEDFLFFVNCLNNTEINECLPPILTPKDIQSLLKIGRSTVYQLLHDKRIKYFRIGPLYRVKKEDFLSFIDACKCYNEKAINE